MILKTISQIKLPPKIISPLHTFLKAQYLCHSCYSNPIQILILNPTPRLAFYQYIRVLYRHRGIVRQSGKDKIRLDLPHMTLTLSQAFDTGETRACSDRVPCSHHLKHFSQA